VARRVAGAWPACGRRPHAALRSRHSIEAVREAIATNTITEPCAIDNEHRLKDAFQNDQGYVPAYYFFDGEGKLRVLRRENAVWIYSRQLSTASWLKQRNQRQPAVTLAPTLPRQRLVELAGN